MNADTNTTDIEVTYFTAYDTGLTAVTLSTPRGDLRFTGCWDSRTGWWHRNGKPIWTFYSTNPNGSCNIEDIEGKDFPRPSKPTKRSFKAAVTAWFKRNG